MKDDTDWSSVLSRAETKLAEDPGDVDASRIRAQATGALEGTARALALMEAHVNDHPNDASAWDLMCAYLLNLGRLAEAQQSGRRALELEPDNGIHHYNLACALALDGQASAAVDSLRIAIDCDAELRDFAMEDESFDPIRTEEVFRALVG